jgi:hypothetical protein
MADPAVVATSIVVGVIKTKPGQATNTLIIGADKTNSGNALRITGTYEQLANLSRRIMLEVGDLQNAAT